VERVWLVACRAPFSHITIYERGIIRTMRTRKCSAATIARTLGKHRSTICRELKRNTDPGCYYYEQHAQAKARRRRKAAKAKSLVIENNPALEHYVLDRFAQRFSPEQIAGWMRVSEYWYPVCQRTIYRWVHRNWQSRKKLLRFKGKPRVPYGARKHFWQPHKRHISERPLVVARKRRVGDWEADLVHGTQDDSRHCLLTINDRATGYVVIRKVQTLHPRPMAELIKIALRGLPVHTITVDNGIEFGHHKTIEKLLKCKVYFTDTNSPQQRGANENLNGLVREFCPKGKSLKHLNQLGASFIALNLNRRPRKRLNFHSPARIFALLSQLPENRVLYRMR
jgi:IS30 family transposase